MPIRRDGDERGHDIADAEQLVPGARELVAAFEQAEWVAERPEVHLGPHVEEWCEGDRRAAIPGS